MKYRLLSACLFIAIFPCLTAAQVKVFYDKSNKKVDSLDGYEYYQTFENLSNGWVYSRYYTAGDTLLHEGAYSKDDKLVGLHKSYFRKSGKLHYTQEYQNGLRHGEIRSYYPEGQLKRIERYEENKFISGECFNEDGSPRAFTPLQQVPVYPGGEEALMQFIAANVEYPRQARKNGVEGVVYTTFVINYEMVQFSRTQNSLKFVF